MRNYIDNPTRELIINKYQFGFSIKEISEFVNLSPNSVSTILKLYKKTGRIYRNSQKNRTPTKLTNHVKEKVQNIIYLNSSVSLKAIKEQILNEDNMEISQTTINRAIKKFNYTLKVIKNIPQRRNSNEVIEIRRQYALEFTRFDQNKIIFIDETGVSIASRSRKGRSLIGTTPIRNVRQLRTNNYTICSSMLNNKILHYQTKSGSFNGNEFKSFIIDLIALLSAMQLNNMIFIMDNCSIHKLHETSVLIEMSNHQLVFLPPYSPFLNPIEEVFSKFKNYIKGTTHETLFELERCILTGFTMITEEDCIGYFNHMRTYISPSIQSQIIN